MAHRVPQGLEDVSKYPDLIAELLRRKWTEEEVKDALANNLLRVLEEVEQVRPLRPEELEVGDGGLGMEELRSISWQWPKPKASPQRHSFSPCAYFPVLIELLGFGEPLPSQENFDSRNLNGSVF